MAVFEKAIAIKNTTTTIKVDAVIGQLAVSETQMRVYSGSTMLSDPVPVDDPQHNNNRISRDLGEASSLIGAHLITASLVKSPLAGIQRFAVTLSFSQGGVEVGRHIATGDYQDAKLVQLKTIFVEA